MDLSLNPAVDPADTTPLVLGGVEFRLAPLGLRQVIRIDPLIPDLLAILNRRAEALGQIRVDGDGALAMAAAELDGPMRALALTAADAEVLISVVHAGLSRCHPRVSRDDMLDLPIGPKALIAAAERIVTLAQLVEKAKTAGEADAASR